MELRRLPFDLMQAIAFYLKLIDLERLNATMDLAIQKILHRPNFLLQPLTIPPYTPLTGSLSYLFGSLRDVAHLELPYGVSWTVPKFCRFLPLLNPTTLHLSSFLDTELVMSDIRPQEASSKPQFQEFFLQSGFPNFTRLTPRIQVLHLKKPIPQHSEQETAEEVVTAPFPRTLHSFFMDAIILPRTQEIMSALPKNLKNLSIQEELGRNASTSPPYSVLPLSYILSRFRELETLAIFSSGAYDLQEYNITHAGEGTVDLFPPTLTTLRLPSCDVFPVKTLIHPSSKASSIVEMSLFSYMEREAPEFSEVDLDLILPPSLQSLKIGMLPIGKTLNRWVSVTAFPKQLQELQITFNHAIPHMLRLLAPLVRLTRLVITFRPVNRSSIAKLVLMPDYVMADLKYLPSSVQELSLRKEFFYNIPSSVVSILPHSLRSLGLEIWKDEFETQFKQRFPSAELKNLRLANLDNEIQPRLPLLWSLQPAR